MKTVPIRPFVPADAAACAGIFERAWNAGHPYAPRRIDVATLEAESRNERLLVAEMPEQGIVGFFSLFEPASFVHHLYIEPAAHGKGIGKALLAAALALAGGRATLKCQAGNPDAMAFYRHLGWTPGERGEAAYGPWVLMHSPE